MHAQLIASRDWGLAHLDELAAQARDATGVSRRACARVLSGLDYGLRYEHLAGLTSSSASSPRAARAERLAGVPARRVMHATRVSASLHDLR